MSCSCSYCFLRLHRAIPLNRHTRGVNTGIALHKCSQIVNWIPFNEAIAHFTHLTENNSVHAHNIHKCSQTLFNEANAYFTHLTQNNSVRTPTCSQMVTNLLPSLTNFSLDCSLCCLVWAKNIDTSCISVITELALLTVESNNFHNKFLNKFESYIPANWINFQKMPKCAGWWSSLACLIYIAKLFIALKSLPNRKSKGWNYGKVLWLSWERCGCIGRVHHWSMSCDMVWLLASTTRYAIHSSTSG